MNTVIYLEKKAQADALLKPFNIQEKNQFSYTVDVSEVLPNGAKAVWCPAFYLCGVLVELSVVKEENSEELERWLKIYEGTSLPDLLTLDRPLNEQDLEEAFGGYFTEKWHPVLDDTLTSLKEAGTIIYNTDSIATEVNFQLMYDLANANAEVVRYTVYSLLPEDIERGWEKVSTQEKGFVAKWDQRSTPIYQLIYGYLKQKTCS